MFIAANNRKRTFASASSSASSKINNCNDNNDDVGGGGGGNISNIKDKNVSTPPTTVEINGIEIHFPFKPYDVQRDYMRGVLTALQNGQHALLESPTGTGKTLCLLCSALAWQRQEKGRIAMMKMEQQQEQTQHSLRAKHQQSHMAENCDGSTSDAANSSSASSNKHPVIIYASRTHSQLSQVVNELRNTRYRPRHAVLGSREHMCIHPKVNPTVANKGRNNKSSSTSSSGVDSYSSDAPTLSSDLISSSSNMDVNNGCNKLNKERKCLFRNNLDDKCAPVEGGGSLAFAASGGGGGISYEQPVMDMEDLVAFGKLNKVCPFYHTRSLLKDAELLFVPYNYLFDRDARESSLAEIDFENSILIFDEAHNLEEFASESASFDLGSGDVAGCIGEVQRALQYMDVNGPENDGLSRQNVMHLKSVLLRFEKYLMESTDMNGAGGGDSSSHPGEYIFDIFQRGAGINHDNLQIFINFVKQVSEFVMEFKGSGSSSRNATSGTPKLDHFLNCLKRAFGSGTHLLALARAKSYRVHVTKIAGGGGFAGGRIISYWCFAPALAMRELTFLKVRSIIITSGTLSPLPSFSMELGLKFPVQLENDHVIQPDQIFVRVIGKGVSGKELTSKYGRRDDPEYILELGNTLASLCNNIPGGVLVFFPSYVAMEAAIQRWGGPSSERNHARQSHKGSGRGAAFFAAAKRKITSAKYVFPMVPNHFRSTATESSPWLRLLARKSIVLEPRSTSELNDAISEYKKFICAPKSTGAILMGVCRGKISEGIDFSDDMCRAVVVTGLPFAPYLDPKVKLKREFLDAARASAKARPSIDGGFGNGKLTQNVDNEAASKTLSGAEWYNQQAHRAVNQAIGRVIRHRHDYGSVLLLDHRFAEVRNKDGLSKWLRPHLRDESIGASTRGLVQFYRDSKIKSENHKVIVQQINRNERPVIRYERNREVENFVSKVTVVHNSETERMSNGYVPEECLIERYDLNNQNPAPAQINWSREVDCIVVRDQTMAESNAERTYSGLGALYSKEKSIQLLPARPLQKTQNSAFDDLDKDGNYGDSPKQLMEQVKRRPQPARKNDAATHHAKIFFEQAKATLVKDELLKLNKLLVAMKTYGDERNEQQYFKAAKDLISVLVDSQVTAARIQLIRSLFPMLPIKYRYKLEKNAAQEVFDKSSLSINGQVLFQEGEFSSVRNYLLPLILNHTESNGSVAGSDRAFLEDTQKILTLFFTHEVNLQYLYDLLPAHLLMRVRALAIEMGRAGDIAKAKERSAGFKGEACVNTALFQPTGKSALVVQVDQSMPEDVESHRIMTEALRQGFDVNRQRKNRLNELHKKNPYQRTALKESTHKNQVAVANAKNYVATKKSTHIGPNPTSQSNLNTPRDIVDECLNHVKSHGFVEPISKLEKINGKIKAHVPKGMTCIVCNETLDQPLMAESCRHSACYNCWKAWLQRSSTCPTCRGPTTMKDLSKLVFSSEIGVGAPTLTQICASDNEEEEESDDEELDIVPS